MKYQVSLPEVSVSEDANFTRRLVVMYCAATELDIRLDESSYTYEFDVAKGREFRVECGYEGDARPLVFVDSVVDKNGEVTSCERFTVTCISDTPAVDVNPDEPIDDPTPMPIEETEDFSFPVDDTSE